MDKLMSHYDEMRRQMTDKKKEEIENAYQRYLYEKTKEEGVFSIVIPIIPTTTSFDSVTRRKVVTRFNGFNAIFNITAAP